MLSRYLGISNSLYCSQTPARSGRAVPMSALMVEPGSHAARVAPRTSIAGTARAEFPGEVLNVYDVDVASSAG